MLLALFYTGFLSNGWSFLNVSKFTLKVVQDRLLQKVEGFINFTLSNSKNISGGGIKCLYAKCKNKKLH